ncbi:hypothetical protein BRLA_c024790 [Brevibacillus laterosporus LMG 15441]|uniref:Uncharacterized protein n=1 Tax=Brevibacillus laterosporus LMG 15441 TaxID=1042163 RepID=A0A075R4Q8_BRELA|nr:hypothetical protein BRLA_c024790 [Brevibacillus laterosporus LMG 15441]
MLVKGVSELIEKRNRNAILAFLGSTFVISVYIYTFKVKKKERLLSITGKMVKNITLFQCYSCSLTLILEI